MLNRPVYNKREIAKAKITELTVGSRGVEHVLTESAYLEVIRVNGTLVEVANPIEEIVDVVGMNNPDITFHSEFEHVCIYDDRSEDDESGEVTFTEPLVDDMKDKIKENISFNSGGSNAFTGLADDVDAKEIIELLNDKRLVEDQD